MDLREPKKKKVGSHIKPQQPFPILIESESGIPVESGLWPLFIGNFMGDCVVVYNPEEMKSLYTMGFFGKGSFSRGYPSFGLTKKGIPPIIKERQWQRRKYWMEKMKQNVNNSLKKAKTLDGNENSEKEVQNNNDSQKTDISVDNGDNSITTVESCSSDKALNNPGNNSSDCLIDNITESNILKLCNSDTSELQSTSSSDKVLILADSDDEDIEKVVRDPQCHLENEQFKTVVETLNLTLEEAFFLSYALGCLQVIDVAGQPMSRKQLWQVFCEVKPDFIESYVVYHYFRAKGWVVKSGYKFGGEFLLYKQGPPFYHASYIVLIEKVDIHLRTLNNYSLTWTKLHGINRLAENSGKDIIICQVIFPDSLTTEDLLTPKSLSSFQVNETLFKRWISFQERVGKE